MDPSSFLALFRKVLSEQVAKGAALGTCVGVSGFYSLHPLWLTGILVSLLVLTIPAVILMMLQKRYVRLFLLLIVLGLDVGWLWFFHPEFSPPVLWGIALMSLLWLTFPLVWSFGITLVVLGGVYGIGLGERAFETYSAIVGVHLLWLGYLISGFRGIDWTPSAEEPPVQESEQGSELEPELVAPPSVSPEKSAPAPVTGDSVNPFGSTNLNQG